MKNIDLLLKPCTPADLDELVWISRKTYYETFIETNTAENMEIYLDMCMSPITLKNELNNNDSIFYLAYVDNQLIGYLKVNKAPAQTERFEQPSLELERIYILKEFHGKRYADIMLQKAIDHARELNVHFLWLGVWENNHTAIRFYKKNGFVKFGEHNFVMGNDVQTDQLMKLDLKN